MDDTTRLLTKIATLYYRNGLTQEQVAQRLGISRQSIGRYLKRAQASGIVEIKIHSPLSQSADFEYQLEKVFHLHEAIVVQPPADTEVSIKEALGEAGAAFLERRVKNGDIIGVSWSSTVLQCATRLGKVGARQVTVVQMNGSLDRTAYSTRAEYIVDRIAAAFGGKAVALAAPLMVDRSDIIESLRSDSRIAAALDLARKANVALFGVGDVSEQSSLFKTGYMDRQMLRKLRAGARGAVGDICGRFYDAQGRVCLPEFDERTLAIELENLRSKELAVAIAGGLHKVEAIVGMLRGRYCNVLITDAETANALLARTSLKEEKGGNAS
jgi:deoxyribonucleoside regulator